MPASIDRKGNVLILAHLRYSKSDINKIQQSVATTLFSIEKIHTHPKEGHRKFLGGGGGGGEAISLRLRRVGVTGK